GPRAPGAPDARDVSRRRGGRSPGPGGEGDGLLYFAEDPPAENLAPPRLSRRTDHALERVHAMRDAAAPGFRGGDLHPRPQIRAEPEAGLSEPRIRLGKRLAAPSKRERIVKPSDQEVRVTQHDEQARQQL